MEDEDGRPKRIVTTGDGGMDKKMGGGIPLGSLILIEGASDSGKSVLTQQFVYGTSTAGFRVTVMTTENTVKSLIRQMMSLNLDIIDYLLLGRLKIFPVKAQSQVNGAKTFGSLLEAFRTQRLQDLVVVDSVTTFIAHASVEDVVAFFEEAMEYCSNGMTIALVAHSYAFSESTLVRIGSMCDAHLRLRTEAVGDRLMKTLEVAKIRGAQQTTGNIINFDVDPGVGMRIVPFSRASA
jgi:flagellar protein FlaH